MIEVQRNSIARRRVILRMVKNWMGGIAFGIVMLAFSLVGLVVDTLGASKLLAGGSALVSLFFITVPILKFYFSQRDGRTLLIWAVIDDDEQSVEELLSAGVNIDEKDKMGNTPLMHAVRTSTLSMVKLLIERGAALNEASFDHYQVGTALILAADKGDPAMLKLLINAGANVNQKDSHGWTALYAAERKNNKVISDLLRRAGAV